MIRSFLSSLWGSTVSALWPYLLTGLLLTNVLSFTAGDIHGHNAAAAHSVSAIVHSNTVQHKAASTEGQAHTVVVTKVETRTKIEKQYVIEHVKDNRSCDVSPDVVRVLNDANH